MNFNPGALPFGTLFQLDVLRISPLAWISVLVLVAYLTGAISLWRRGRGWPVANACSFIVGCVAWFAVTGLSANAYAGELVSVLLFQQITLLVVVPPFLLMGSPGRLVLRATPRRGLGRTVLRVALGAYRSRAAQVLLHPVVAIVVAVLAFPTLYFTDAVSWIMATPGGHLALLAWFLMFGVIGGAPLWALDPLPRSPSFTVRIIDVLIEIQIHAIFGLMLLRSTGPMFQWYADDPTQWGITRALDQAIGGGMVWSYGELPLILVLIVTISKWRKSDIRRAKQRQPQEDADLDAYNQYLAERYGNER